MLRFMDFQRAYLPPAIAQDYPTVPNPWGQVDLIAAAPEVTR